MKILWISQTLVTSKPDATIGQTDRVEMPRQVERLGHRVKVVLGSSLFDILSRKTPIPFTETVYLPMVNLPFMTTISFQIFLSFLFPIFLYRFAPDVVLIDYFSILSVIPWVLAKKLGLIHSSFILDLRTLPVDLHKWRGHITSLRFDLSLRFAKKYMDGLTVITSGMRQHLSKQFGIPNEWMGVWESGVDMEKFLVARTRRDELGWSDKFIVMYHGAFSTNRGLQSAIRAFVELKSEFKDVRFCLIGAGEAKDELEKLVYKLHLEDTVFLYPPVPYSEIADYVVSSDVGIIPLPDIEWWNTSSPLKLMEYLAAGKPVIVSQIAAHRSILGNNQCAYFLEEVSHHAIADGVRYFYKLKGELPLLGNASREIVCERYSWARQAKALIDYLHKSHSLVMNNIH